jgi:hypothetical protein
VLRSCAVVKPQTPNKIADESSAAAQFYTSAPQAYWFEFVKVNFRSFYVSQLHRATPRLLTVGAVVKNMPVQICPSDIVNKIPPALMYKRARFRRSQRPSTLLHPLLMQRHPLALQLQF